MFTHQLYSKVFAVWILLSGLLSAHSPILIKSFPMGGVRGQNLELLCDGDRLEEAISLIFYQPGIQAGKPKVIEKKKVIFPITIDKNAALGEHLFRLQCKDGLTELRAFWVGPYPSIIEKTEPNNTPTEAQKISKNHTIIGQTTPEDLDYYKISLKKDQVISLEMEAMRLNRIFFDSFIAIHDKDNRELISSDDSLKLDQDPRLSFKATYDGDYYIMVRDASFQGHVDARYRLHVGDFLFTHSIHPLGAQIGKPQTFTLTTKHEGSLHKTKTYSKKEAKNNLIDIFPTIPNQPHRTAPTPHKIRVTEFGIINEKEPNTGIKHSNQALIPQLPIAFHGTIATHNDQDWFRFNAKKGQKIRAQVYARNLGSPIDTSIQFHHPDGKFINFNDNASQGEADSKLEFTAPTDGEYWIIVKDILKRYSPLHHYRLELTEVKPHISATLAHKRLQETQRWKTFSLAQGNRMAYQINLAKTAIKDELEVISDSLPKGITFKTLYQIKNDNKAVIVLEAKENTPIQAGIYTFSVRTKDPMIVSTINTQVYPFLGRNNQTFTSFNTDKIALAVTSPAPAKIEIIQPTQPIVQSGVLSLKIKATRSEGFEGDINVEIPWKPAGISANYSLKIPKGKTEATIQLAADNNAPIGKWDFCVRASANTKRGMAEFSSNIIPIEIQAPYLSAQLEIAATTQGVSTNIICKINHLTPFEGKAQLTLHGLPDGIIASPVNITKDTKEVSIPISVPADARIGKHANLFCQIPIPLGKDKIIHTIGQGGVLRVNPPAKKKKKLPTKLLDQKKTTEKKPLSRLEQLRQQ